MRKWTILAAAFVFASCSFAASNPFSDVGRTHWAYSAIGRAVDAGILQGFDGKFHGDKLVNRYQMAVIIKKILDHVSASGGMTHSGGSMSSADIQNLEQLTIEFADELALLNVKVSTLEDSFTELRNQVDNMKVGGGAATGGSAVGNAFTGFVSVALISTDDQLGATAPTPAGSNTRYAATSDQTVFTMPQASIALDTEVGDGIGLHVQYDYATDAVSGGAVGAAGVALNEAYLFVDEIFGDMGGKIGGFALPFQSWEVNGGFRSCDMTITPSVKNTALEGIRVIGLELEKTKDVDPSQMQWSLGIFNGGDIAAGANAANFGAMNDGVGLGTFTGTISGDDKMGFFLDLESGDDPDKSFGWRLGYLTIGGDYAPGPGLFASQEIDGFQVGFWWKNDTMKIILEYMSAEEEWAAGTGNGSDNMAWYFMLNWSLQEDSSITLRYDSYENETTGPGNVGTEGDAFTLAWNRQVSDTSMFQFEYVSPDNDTLAGGGNTDFDDDLIQFRYKVWF